jgi:hypothetical protein
MQELSLERERSANLDETVRLLKEQASIYQVRVSIKIKGLSLSKWYQEILNHGWD